MEKVYIVVEDNVQEGIEVFIYRSEEQARGVFTEIVEHYKSVFKELGDGEINKYFAHITDKWNDEVARVFWQENIIN